MLEVNKSLVKHIKYQIELYYIWNNKISQKILKVKQNRGG